MAPRILLCGDPLGRLNQLFKRVQSVNKSAGPFDALLCVGQFFPDSPELLPEFLDYIEGRTQIPIPTYFIGDYGLSSPKILTTTSNKTENQGFKMDGLKIIHNLYWLRGSGKFTLHNLTIVYLSGRQSSDSQPFGKYNQNDIDAIRALADEDINVVDLFLTNDWPAGVTNRSSVDVSEVGGGVCGDLTVAELVMEIKPRYHIAGSNGVFYAREPYLNAEATHVTRFIGVAQVGNRNKQKFLHAISPIPTSEMSESELSVKPPNTTLPPYTLQQGSNESSNESKKRSNDSELDSQYWRYDDVSKRRKGTEDGKLCFKFVCSGSCPRGESCHFRHDVEAREQCRRGVCLDLIIKGKCEKGPECSYKHEFQSESVKQPTKSRGECWFCLSSQSLESHLIVSVGESFYCALPKGSLVDDHVLVIPIEHLPNTLVLSNEGEMELGRYMNGLRDCYKRQGNDAVFFELVSNKRVSHANLQVVPVPSSRTRLLPNIFSLAAEKLGFKLVTKKFSDSSEGRKYLQKEYNADLGMFYVELPDGTVLVHTLEENEVFPAQFGREVLAGLLKIPNRADWRNCKISQEEEAKLVEEFKKQFQEFDPFQ